MPVSRFRQSYCFVLVIRVTLLDLTVIWPTSDRESELRLITSECKSSQPLIVTFSRPGKARIKQTHRQPIVIGRRQISHQSICQARPVQAAMRLANGPPLCSHFTCSSANRVLFLSDNAAQISDVAGARRVAAHRGGVHVCAAARQRDQ
jgi:hypothetical protein